MATSYPFSTVVLNNMVLCLDSLNTKSYGGSGNNWLDLTSHSNNFLLVNSPMFDSMLNFDGVDQYGIISYNSDFNLSSTNFTIEGYFMSNSFGSAFALVSSDTYGSNFDWGLIVNDNQTLIFYSNGTSTNVTATVPTMSPGIWYHYVVTCEGLGPNIRIYLNGVLYEGPTTMSISNTSQLSITVGALGGPVTQAYFLNGKLSTIRIYKYALTDQEVIQNYNSLKNRFQ